MKAIMKRATIVVATVALLTVAWVELSDTSSLGTFSETFGGTPAGPKPWAPSNWDVAVHTRDADTRLAPEPMMAMHGDDCAGPPMTHQMSTYEDAVFQCRDHVMTSLNATSYGVTYLTPDHMVDSSQSPAVVSWDMSTLRTSLRDWVDVWIAPFENNMILPFESSDPDLQWPPRNAVHIHMDWFDGKPIFKVSIYKDLQLVEVPDQRWWQSYDEVLAPDVARRDTFQLTIGRDHVKFGMPAYDLWWADTAIADLGFDTGVVQFGHHSYNPLKDCTGTCSPNTWHWDNVKFSPATAFTMIGSDQRLVDGDSATNVMQAQLNPLRSGPMDHLVLKVGGPSSCRACGD